MLTILVVILIIVVVIANLEEVIACVVLCFIASMWLGAGLLAFFAAVFVLNLAFGG